MSDHPESADVSHVRFHAHSADPEADLEVGGKEPDVLGVKSIASHASESDRTKPLADHPASPKPVTESTPMDHPTGRKARWLRWWKSTRLYELTSTGHEDECAFECSSVAGRKCRYWPPLYKQADLDASRWLRMKRFFTFYIRPGMMMGICVLMALWFFQQMNNFSTWRTNRMADEHGYAQPPADGNLRTDYSAGAQPDYPNLPTFFLDDLVHEWIPAAGGASYRHWHLFVDYSLVGAIVFSLLFRLAMRDMVRLGEWAAVAITLFTVDGILHVVTVYPDPWGSSGSCQNREHRTYGSWIWHNFNTDYCGDQMFSGHTFNFITALIMFRRVWFDLIGWDTLPLTSITHSTASYRRSLDALTQLGMGNEAPRWQEPPPTEEARARARGVGWGDTDIRNRKVVTQHPDETSLPGVDLEGEAREAKEPLALGSSVLVVCKLALAEGLGKTRALELARLLRLPIHGQADASATEMERLRPAHPRKDEQREGTDRTTENGASSLHLPVEDKEYSALDGVGQRSSKSTGDIAAADGSTAEKLPRAIVGGTGTQHLEHRTDASDAHDRTSSERLPGGLPACANAPIIGPASFLDIIPRGEFEAKRVVRVLNGPLGDMEMSSNSALPPNAMHDAIVDHVAVPMMARSPPFRLSGAIPASHGGPHVGGHYGASEGAVNNSRLWKSTGHSDLPCPEWDDVRGHGMNANMRFRINAPIRERIIMSRAPPPFFARAYPRATWWACNVLRGILIAWTAVFLVGIIRIRYHYGADVLVSILVTVLVNTNEKLLQFMVPYLYLPVDARYADAPMYPFAIDPQLYEETLSKVGVGGLI